MGRVRTRIAVTGFTEAEATVGIPHLLEEFSQRPWLLAYDAKWVAEGSKLVVSVESEGDRLEVQGGTTGANVDEVWDCVIACLTFSSEGIQFEIEDSRFVSVQSEDSPLKSTMMIYGRECPTLNDRSNLMICCGCRQRLPVRVR